MDLALHPRFSENKLVYFTYHKPPRRRHRQRGDHHARARTMGRHGAGRGSRRFLRHSKRQRFADHLRQRRHGVHDGRRRRSSAGRTRAGSERPGRQGAAAARRWNRSAGQPFRQSSGVPAGDLHDGPSQCAGPGRPAGHRRHLGMRGRTQWRRRDQYSAAGQELRMAGRELWPVLSGAARDARIHGRKGWSSRWCSGCRRSPFPA